MLRASRHTAHELGNRLGIHPELAAFVVNELQTQRRIDDGWAVTRRGIQILDEKWEESADLAPGWVFKDPWNANLWPFVAPSLEYGRTGQDENGRVVLEIGTTGRPRQQRAWLQRPPNGQHPATPPDVHQILRAARQHRRLERRRQDVQMASDEDDVGSASVAGLDLNRVTSIEPVPDLVYLVSFLYVPREGDDADWHACEFFGRGTDPALRRVVAHVAEDNEGLARQLDRLLGRTTHGGDFARFKRIEQERHRRARRLMERTLSIDIARHEEMVDALVEMIEGSLELDDLGDAASRRRRRDVLTSCRRSLERLFAEIRRDWPLAGMADRLSRQDKEMKEAVLQNATEKVGLTGLPDAIRRVKPSQIRAVSDYDDDWRLRPLVAATLLRAGTDPNHPMRAAAGNSPDLLDRIERVAALAGEAAHDGDSGGLDADAVDTSVQETLEIVGLLLNLPVRSMKEILRNGQEQEEPAE